MPRKLQQLKADLRRLGAEKVHRRGDHEKWTYPLIPDLHVELAGSDGDERNPIRKSNCDISANGFATQCGGNSHDGERATVQYGHRVV
ncbi:MAG: hypothetical protein ACHQ4H_13095 [Ktedonobacterales bacterium]